MTYMANRGKKGPNVTDIREMKIKTTMRYHITLVGMAIIQNKKITDISKDVKKRESMYTVGGKVNWCSHYGEQYEVFLKN